MRIENQITVKGRITKKQRVLTFSVIAENDYDFTWGDGATGIGKPDTGCGT
jgi:hypothetical protein